ncbi:sensor histidine kinase [Anaerotalea alkaliphila]|uniref:histidine kinase n=1 Tax=Anaerotalea alkaliphila TaxID=2662126 RepID=A0A7X5HY16_9FIRM|nr:sensor histidine kinase [Anaerotalea alkaliphila]NDL68691.1 sensor histidine kinase [Anaerotalea alkaliphila]
MGRSLGPRQGSLGRSLGLHMVVFALLGLGVTGYLLVGQPAGNWPLFVLLPALWANLQALWIRVYRPIRQVEEELELFGEGRPVGIHELIQQLKESVDREYAAGILKREAEISALQSQINPHFLYNVLDSIRGHAMAEGVEEIADMTEALSSLFRYSISHREADVTLERELHHVRSYFKIQQYRFNNKFDLRVLVEGEAEKVLACRLPKLTLQPILENAIYHGLEMKLGPGLVTIRARVRAGQLQIAVTDDGMGVEPERLERINRNFQEWENARRLEGGGGSGIALANVNSRIKMLHGEAWGLHMASTPGLGATVEVLLPAVRD